MHLSGLLVGLAALAAHPVAAKVNELVSWDKYSLKVNGTRVFIKSDALRCLEHFTQLMRNPVVPLSSIIKDSQCPSFGMWVTLLAALVGDPLTLWAGCLPEVESQWIQYLEVHGEPEALPVKSRSQLS
jgi:hypothetical protein